MLAQSKVGTLVRHPDRQERLPGEYASYPSPDRSWVWVCEGESGIAGYLMACPCHGMVMLVRAIKVTGEPANWLLSCIRQARRECAERGFEGWFMPIVSSDAGDVRILKIARRFSSAELPAAPMIVMGGKICR